MSIFIETLFQRLKLEANSKESQAMAKYMRNQFEFLGVRAPKVKEHLKEHLGTHNLLKEDYAQAVKDAWNYPEREMQYVGMYMMDMSKHDWSRDSLEDTFEHMIVNKSWWDTVDFISSSLLHHYMETQHPHHH